MNTTATKFIPAETMNRILRGCTERQLDAIISLCYASVGEELGEVEPGTVTRVVESIEPDDVNAILNVMMALKDEQRKIEGEVA